MKRTVARALLLTSLAFALCGQADEEQPYFSLGSNKTFAPGEKATIELSATDIDSLDFRVYRIKDPVRFFAKLPEPHQFGGMTPRPARELTWIERFHRAKFSWHAEMHDLVRQQFTGESWKSVGSFGKGKTDFREHNVTNLAAAPLLNSQQVVATWRQRVQSQGRWRSQTIDAEVKDKGVYLVEAARGDLRAYTIVMVSDIAVISKSLQGKLIAYVADRQTGEPIANSSVTYQEPKKPAVTVATDAQGLANFHAEPGDTNNEVFLFAKSGSSFAATTTPAYGAGQTADLYTGYTYTDRPVYRPGHQVSFKSILRTHQGNVYRLPALANVNVEVQGPDDKTVYRKTLNVSAAGAVAGDFTLPRDAGLGYYNIQIHAAEAQFTAGFQVEEYKKPEYDVRVTLAKPRVMQGDPIAATIDARYFFGEPVAGAKVHYVVHRSRYWFPSWQTDDQDAGEGNQDDAGGDEQLSDEEGKLHADGKLTISIPTAVDEHKWDARYRIEARVTDAGNREISGSVSGVATYGSYWVTVEPSRYVLTPGAPADFKVQARDYENNAVSAKVQVDLLDRDKRGGNNQDGAVLQHAEGQTDPQGEAHVSLAPPKGGSYRVRVRSMTPTGREVENFTYVWVSSEGAGMFGDESEQIQIVPDKKAYRPGDVAKVLILTGVPGTKVLYTLEGRSLSDARVLDAPGTSVTVEVPITALSEPDFYIGAAFLKGNKLHVGSKAIRVPPTEHKLSLTLTQNKPQYQPGETAQLTLDARDAAGKPVAGDFSLGVVDEAIYGIRPDSTMDIMRAFYGPGYNAVTMTNSLTYYFNGEAGKRRMELARLHRTRSLAQLKPDRMVQPKVRKSFPDTALWLASVHTDGSGRATASVAFPDSITTWRTTVRGATTDTKVGSVVQKTLVRKNVILRLVVPRFFTAGDEVTVSAVVHNYLPDDKKARVSLDVKGLEIIDGAARDLIIPSKGEVKVDYRVRASLIGNATITGKALTDTESDAMELTMPVEPQGVKMSLARAGSLSSVKPQADVKLDFPAETVAASRNIEISVTPSIAGALFGAIDYLTQFPYGCTEQTLSSFVPNIVVSKALADLGIHSDVNRDRLNEKIRAGLDRLYDFQHDDGGWGWWKSDDSGIFMTANTVAGLAQAKLAGRELKADTLERGAKWLRQAYDREPRMLPDLKAYAAYALALANASDPKVLDDVWQKKDGLTPYGRAILGLTYGITGDKQRASALATQLESEVKTNDAEAWWPGDRDSLMDFWFDVTPESTAFALKLLVHERPQSPLLDKAAVYLMNHRRDGWFWASTKQTAMVIYGLTDYLKATGELKPNIQATVSVNGKQVLTKQFSMADALSIDANTVTIPAADLAAASNTIHVESNGTGRVYWSARANYHSTAQKLVKVGSSSLNLLRDYFKLTQVKEDGKILYNLDPLAGPLAVGDVLAVRITVTGSDWKYLLVEDPIPAGAEFIERDDLYALKTKPDWWSTFFTRREFHDDRAALFDTYFPAGQKQYFYLLKIVNPGQFRVSPARVQPMYQPDFLSTTENRSVEVK